ncbi:hypothetical protein EsH8_IV_000239 [Colletotrichum jinshuiense]
MDKGGDLEALEGELNGMAIGTLRRIQEEIKDLAGKIGQDATAILELAEPLPITLKEPFLVTTVSLLRMQIANAEVLAMVSQLQKEATADASKDKKEKTGLQRDDSQAKYYNNKDAKLKGPKDKAAESTKRNKKGKKRPLEKAAEGTGKRQITIEDVEKIRRAQAAAHMSVLRCGQAFEDGDAAFQEYVASVTK